MLKKTFVLIPLLAVLAMGSVAHAETSPAKKALIDKVLKLQQPNVEALARGVAERPAAALMQQAGVALQSRVAADKREAVGKEIQADVKKYVDEAVPIVRDRAVKLAPTTVGPVLEEKLTEAELRKVLAVLESMDSPEFKKYQQVGVDMQKALIDKLVAEAAPMVDPKLKALEQSVAGRLGIPLTPAPAGK